MTNSQRFLYEVESIRHELLVEAPTGVNKKFRKMIYKYETQLPGERGFSSKRRQMSKVPGFKEALKKFRQSPDISTDRLRLRDALNYIDSDNRTPHFSKDLYSYNHTELVSGLKEIKQIHNSSLSDAKKYKKLKETLRRIRNFHVFKSGPLSSKDYTKAWNTAFHESVNSGKYDHKKFVAGIKEMVSGIKHFDMSFVKTARKKYSK